MIEITEPIIAASRGRNPDNPSDRTAGVPTEQRLEMNTQGISNTLTTVQKDNWVVEPQILKYERTDYAKSIRKEYESGQLSERRCNMRQYTTRKDRLSNTLTTVQKDNYLLEPINPHEDGTARTLKAQYFSTSVANFEKTGTYGATGVAVWGKNKQVDTSSYINEIVSKDIETPVAIDEQNVKVRTDGLVETLMTDGSSPKKNNRVCCTDLRIRKLTPKECWRLMGFSDDDFDKVHGISNTQLYKMAGNSIVANLLEGIFRELFKAQSR